MADGTLPILECKSLTAGYGRSDAIRHIDCFVEPGEVVAIIGANGAGKSTLMRSVMGFLKPREGAIYLDGVDIRKRKPHQVSRMGVGYVPEGRELFPSLTVGENLTMGWKAGNSARNSRVDAQQEAYERFPVLADRRNQLAGTLSGGEQQMVAMARAWIGRPGLYLLDEPSLGLAPLIQDTVFELIASWRSEGVSVLLVEQNARRALHVCDRAYVMAAGEIVATGSPDELGTNTSLDEAYFGAR